MTSSPYPDVNPRAEFAALERRVLERWDRSNTFERSVAQRPARHADGSNNEFVFYDGPPFANGLPHYGHLLTGYVKDVIPRYQTMLGRRVERRFGWDCHGLPAEMKSEQELGISGHVQINGYGVERFNEHCRSSVLHYTGEWQRYVTRQARWVDFDDDYKTMDLPYMESVMWAFKRLFDQGLVYEANRVMPYSWGAETPLSNFEIRLDDATRPRQDPALTVRFELSPAEGDPGPMEVWAWTTTPWTLPSNLALAVGPQLNYRIVALGEGPDLRHVVIGDAAADAYAPELEGGRTVATLTGADLVGRSYAPLFDYFADREGAFVILGDDFVSTDEGTGVVHLAPGHGEDDQRVCEAAGIVLVSPVDEAGRFTPEVADWQGINVFEANPLIIRHLKELGRVIRHVTYEHNYAHCWRTDTPIIYRAISSWFVRVTDLRDRMVELNQEINWIPSHVRDGQFGRWLEGARDWSISRNRFWGAPIPVWLSDDPEFPRIDVYGSLDELERDFGVLPRNGAGEVDLHRPFIDGLTRPNPDDPSGRSTMRRVPEVLDCWFESGSMPFAQVHYPFEKGEWFDSHAPADFIVEYVAQTRGWFYTLHVLSTALFDRPAFRNVICHGVVLDHAGQKLSKKLRNYVDPEELMQTQGADALRWYLMASPIVRGGDLRVSTDGREVTDVVRLVLNPIWNAYVFFTTYANAEGYRARTRTDATHVLDRYLLAKTRSLRDAVTAALDAYDIPGACNEITAFLDALTNWYIRRSRPRFWNPQRTSDPSSREGAPSAGAAGAFDAFDTLYTVLGTLCRISAPLLPMITEEIFSSLTGDESVHLTDWPGHDDLPDDPDLVAAMDRVRAVCSTALSLREERRLRARLPLSGLIVAGTGAPDLSPYFGLIADELNVKQVTAEVNQTSFGTPVLRPNARVLGPRLGGRVQEVLQAARAGDWTHGEAGTVRVAGVTLGPDDFELSLAPSEGQATAVVRMLDPEGRSVDLGLVVALDVAITPELEAEGRARDLVRIVQQARRDEGLHVSDRIRLVMDLDDDGAALLGNHLGWVADQVLASEWTRAPVLTEGARRAALEEFVFDFSIERA